jgi:NAD+ kinase
VKIAIFENTFKLHAVETAAEAAEILTGEGAEVLSYNIDDLKSVFDIADTDVIIVIGGDGTILKAAQLAADNNIPLLGINTGRLGFMASIERTELRLLKNLTDGGYSISERMRVTGDILRDGEILATMSAVNEIAAVRPLSKLTDFVVKAGEQIENVHTVCSFRADGVIVATPTGSTAYALANGGAIIEPNAPCMELTPISAHSLSMRPMIFSPDTSLFVSHEISDTREMGETITVNADGVPFADLCAGDVLRISRSLKPLRLVDLKPNVFYESVNGKLFQSLK